MTSCWKILSSIDDKVLATPKSQPIKDYFSVISERERKCDLCSAIVKVVPASDWGMRSHLMKKHSIESKRKIQPFLRKPKSQQKTVGRSNTSESMSYDSNEDLNFDGLDAITEPFERITDDDERGTGAGRGSSSSVGQPIVFCPQNCAQKDEFNVFGDFVATELRNMKTDQMRCEFKRGIQKCWLEVTANCNE